MPRRTRGDDEDQGTQGRRPGGREPSARPQLRPTTPGRPDRVFNLLQQMREARPGQRIEMQVPLNLNVDKPDEGEDEPTPAGEPQDPEAANEVGDESDESSTKPDSRGIP